jgi:hypothetical protein
MVANFSIITLASIRIVPRGGLNVEAARTLPEGAGRHVFIVVGRLSSC